MKLKRSIGHDFFLTAATLVAVGSCAVKELPPPDGWEPDTPPLAVPGASPNAGELPTLGQSAPRNPAAGLPTLGQSASLRTAEASPASALVVDHQKLLDSHNSIRQRLGIPALRWSARLESYAADWANFLTTQADCLPRRRGSAGLSQNGSRLGENLALLAPVRFGDGRTESAAIDESKVVLDWVRQGIEYNYDDNECGIGKVCENYTQVVWRDTQVMGCAAASCPDKSQIWVCNYDPPGNFFDQKPY